MEANIVQVKSSHVDGLNFYSLVVSLMITTPTIFYSDVYEWILDTGSTYHISPMVKYCTLIQHTKVILDYVHTDVWGPTKMTSLENMHYFVSFMYDFSRRCRVYTMRHKGEDLFAE